jgi:hypothetical protein
MFPQLFSVVDSEVIVDPKTAVGTAFICRDEGSSSPFMYLCIIYVNKKTYLVIY